MEQKLGIIITVLQNNVYHWLSDGLAVDWVTNKLYFTDAALDIIGVLDPNNRNYIVLIRTGPSTQPRAIVLDPNTR